METLLNYLLAGFGYKSQDDLGASLLKPVLAERLGFTAAFSAAGALLIEVTGMEVMVALAFCLLVIAEFLSGIMVSVKVKGERFQSCRCGRIIMKTGIYLFILALLNIFALHTNVPDLGNFSLNPFKWLYYTVFVAIVFQLLISWLENLGQLGYKETKTIAGFVLRKLNKWFEFDGNKNNHH